MSNSKVITCKFGFTNAKSMDDALDRLQGDNVKILAGGTDLINQIKTNKTVPSEVVYIGNILELRRLSSSHGLTIGAAAVMEDIENDALVKKDYPGLAEAINSVGGWQIRNVATITGNICNASPGADTVPALLVHQAVVTIAARKAGGGISERTVALEDFLTGPGKTAMEKGELVTAVKIPKVPAGSSSAFLRIARVTLDIAKINCAAWIQMDSGVCKDVRIAIGSVAATVVRAPSVEKMLKGKEITDKLIGIASIEAEKDISPITDIRSTMEYRKQVVKILVRDVLLKAVERAKGDRI